jgi:hypothetical protein
MLEKVECCPECNSELKAGWIGERGRIRWYDKQRKIITVFNQGESLLKHEFWRGRFGEQEARRCLNCGLVLFKSEPKEKKSFLLHAFRIILFIYDGEGTGQEIGYRGGHTIWDDSIVMPSLRDEEVLYDWQDLHECSRKREN